MIEIKSILKKKTDKLNIDDKAEADIKETSSKKNKKRKKLLDYNIVRFLLVLLLLAACAGLGAGYAIYEDRSDPTQFVAEYFGNFLVRKYDEMYKYVDLEDKQMSKEQFVSMMGDLRQKHNFGQYDFQKPKKERDGRYCVKVKYTDSQSGEAGDFDIYLAKKSNVFETAFTDWKISIDDYLVEDIAVVVPEGMKLEIDSEKIDKTKATVTTESMSEINVGNGQTIKLKGKENNMKVYRIKSLPKGTHAFKAYTPYSLITAESEIEKSGARVIMQKSTEYVNKKYKDKIKETTESLISEYYNLVKDKDTGIGNLKKLLADDKSLRKTVKKYVAEDVERFFWQDIRYIDDYSLKELSFSKINPSQKYKGDGRFSVTCKFSLKYRCATDTDFYTSYIASFSGGCDVTLKMSFKRDADKLIITSFEKKTQEYRDE